MSKRKEKKKKFVKGQKKKAQSNTLKFVLGSAAAIIVLVALVFVLRPSEKGVGEKVDTDDAASYGSETVEMTDITAKVEGGKIIVPVKEVEDNKIVYFEYQGSATTALVAYLSPSGRIVTAISMCEPCKGTRFHIEGDTLVCNACGTRWNLDTLKGISGGCMDYPPDILEKVTIENDQIVIEESEVVNWKPRV